MTSPDSTPDRTPESSPESTPTPSPVPQSAARPPVPAPPPRRVAPSTPRLTPPAPAAAPERPEEDRAADAAWGRVDDDGTVYVRTTEGERAVGQMPDASPVEALEFFTRRFADLVFEVELLERRIGAGALAPDEAAAAVRQVRATVHGANAVGDLAALEARMDALDELVRQQRARRREERARRQESARADKERVVGEAEALADGSDWRNGANRMRDLLDEWKALPRLEKSVDDALWRRFSTARTTYTRRRKAHFAELNEQRESARGVKERLVAEAEELAGSTDWGPTAARYRELMRQWKAVGPAPKAVDDELWKRFRAAQDAFFGARDNLNAELDRELAANAVTKEALLAEAEALLPVGDLRSAKDAFRSIAERWDAAGKVPRGRVRELEARMRAVEQAIRGVEDDQWRRSNPEARARAADTVAKLQSSIADLERQRDQARAAGDEAAAARHDAAAEARRSWLDQAQRALDDFGG